MNHLPSPESDPLLTERGAAALLAISVRTLQAWRSKGTGPAYVRVGRVIRYRRGDLLKWIEKNTSAAPST